ncbi:DUF2207 domain-containing protein [Aestuariimicrobium sp. p3-SID1156]|uniref:DUF2207 domain-containing protein n=1 Tax=Aestuariimicrobium sp. p3-SID1156 TaxID=2916038 RepID=UPI00223B4573|nr:DUF2207 domain-containing protein [Aestuariimicrobium sp. p3-SID1156]MCT1459001.1 DUF2207 domain-containing protein [Aestuariimicrobium sp. p3-SID1156]
MSNVEVGLLVLAVLIWAVVGGVHLLTRQFGRDRIFRGVTPGQLPGPSASTEVERVKGGREYRGEVAVQFHPPRGLTPGLVGTVVDGRAEMRDVTATILDLAVRKYLRITPVEQGPSAPAGGRPRQQMGQRPGQQGKDWLITLLRDPEHPAPGERPLLPFEQRLVTALFSRRPEVRMSELGSRFGTAMHAAQNDLYDAVQRLGWYSGHPQSRGGCLGVVAVIAGILGGVMFWGAGGGSIWSAISGILVAGAGFSLANALKWRTPRTAEGTAVQIQTLGFKKYLETAEADQIKFEEAADIFSRYLPYAIVFGVADHWAKVFGEVAARAQLQGVEMPLVLDWFDGLYLGMLVDDLLFDAVDGMGMLDMVDGFDLMSLGGDAVGGLGEIAGNLGDFVGGLDFGDFDF